VLIQLIQNQIDVINRSTKSQNGLLHRMPMFMGKQEWMAFGFLGHSAIHKIVLAVKGGLLEDIRNSMLGAFCWRNQAERLFNLI